MRPRQNIKVRSRGPEFNTFNLCSLYFRRTHYLVGVTSAISKPTGAHRVRYVIGKVLRRRDIALRGVSFAVNKVRTYIGEDVGRDTFLVVQTGILP